MIHLVSEWHVSTEDWSANKGPSLNFEETISMATAHCSQ